MDPYLFFYLFYNIHNERFLDRLEYKWIFQKYVYYGSNYQDIEIDNIFEPRSILEFTRNAEYFIEWTGFNKELNLFEPQYWHIEDESLYSQKLDFIFMAYAKKTMHEVFTVDHSYEKLFASVASEYAEHAKMNKLRFIERQRSIKESGIISKPNFGYTNNSLGYFSNAILKKINDKHIFQAYCFTDYIEMYEFFLNRWENDSIIRHELLIAKKIIHDRVITTTNFLEISKNGFEINNEISLLIKKLQKLKNNEK